MSHLDKKSKKSGWKNPYISLLRIAWKYAGKQRKRFLVIYSLFFLANLVHAIYPVFWGWFINEIQFNGMGALKVVWIYAGVYMALNLAEWFFHGPARVWERELAFDLSKNFLQEMYHKSLHLPVKWHQDNHSGATINRIRKAYEALSRFFQDGFEYLHSFFKFVFSFIAMIYFAPIFGLIAVFLGFFVVIIILKFDKPYIATLHEVNEREHVVSSTLFDSLSNIITVITLRLEKRMEGSLLQKVMEVFPPFRKNIRINEWKWFVTDILVNLIYILILVGYVYQNWIPGEVFLIGGLVTVMAYVNSFTSVFHNIAYQYTDIVRHNTDVSAALPILEAYEQEHLPEVNDQLAADWQEMNIKNLNFYHSERAIQNSSVIHGLQKVCLQINRGKKIALIGESGSGKSTLLAILRGLYLPENGVQLLIDKKFQADFELITNQVTLFPQEPEIFENSIEYNITLGLSYEKAEIERICKIVHFKEVVDNLPKGLASSIQEKGVNLSGGQKQRLALARGVVAAQDSQVILLDEPTSSVDPKTEMEIYDKLFREFADKAVVSSLHRLHLLTYFDYIYVMENGRIVEEGTLEELKSNGLAFKELWQHQELVVSS